MAMPRINVDLLEVSGDGYGDILVDGSLFTGIGVEFGPANELTAETPYQSGKLHGPVRAWYPGGRMRSEEYFHMGARHGAWREWDEHGRLVREEVWEHYQPVYKRAIGAEGELLEGVSMLVDQSPARARWLETRARFGQVPIVELVDDEFVDVPWPFDDLLPEGAAL